VISLELVFSLVGIRSFRVKVGVRFTIMFYG